MTKERYRLCLPLCESDTTKKVARAQTVIICSPHVSLLCCFADAYTYKLTLSYCQLRGWRSDPAPSRRNVPPDSARSPPPPRKSRQNPPSRCEIHRGFLAEERKRAREDVCYFLCVRVCARVSALMTQQRACVCTHLLLSQNWPGRRRATRRDALACAFLAHIPAATSFRHVVTLAPLRLTQTTLIFHGETALGL